MAILDERDWDSLPRVFTDDASFTGGSGTMDGTVQSGLARQTSPT